MKNFRVLCAAFVLTTALSLPAYAGEIGTGIANPQPPPPAAGDIGTGATDGEIGTGATSDGTNATAELSVAGIALSLLQSVLALV